MLAYVFSTEPPSLPHFLREPQNQHQHPSNQLPSPSLREPQLVPVESQLGAAESAPAADGLRQLAAVPGAGAAGRHGRRRHRPGHIARPEALLTELHR